MKKSISFSFSGCWEMLTLDNKHLLSSEADLSFDFVPLCSYTHAENKLKAGLLMKETA